MKNTYITFSCIDPTQDLASLIEIFQEIGWSVYNKESQVELTFPGDFDCFDWKKVELSKREVTQIIQKKEDAGEPVAINLFYEQGNEGLLFCAKNTADISLGISIYARRIDDRHVDMYWYEKHLMDSLLEKGIISAYRFEVIG